MWSMFVAFTLVFTLNGKTDSIQGVFEAHPQLYGSACHQGLHEYREELKKLGGSLVWFECAEGIVHY